jgi:hypothetical protein
VKKSYVKPPSCWPSKKALEEFYRKKSEKVHRKLIKLLIAEHFPPEWTPRKRSKSKKKSKRYIPAQWTPEEIKEMKKRKRKPLKFNTNRGRVDNIKDIQIKMNKRQFKEVAALISKEK